MRTAIEDKAMKPAIRLGHCMCIVFTAPGERLFYEPISKEPMAYPACVMINARWRLNKALRSPVLRYSFQLARLCMLDEVDHPLRDQFVVFVLLQ